ncbi:MAG: Mur ligase family protein [Gemmatimonadota bacterium]
MLQTDPAAPGPSRLGRRTSLLTVRTFDDACRFLFPRTRGIKWGLETTEALLGALGHPERHFTSVHVGGTNGKGSTCAMLASVMRAAGFRVGLYTSPHLVSFRERVVVDGVAISESAVAAWVGRLEEVAIEREASFFEITTAAAFADLAARGAEIAIIEVGLGGRLDSTNVLTPVACGVTRIALEHTDYLGPDLAGIAREKAGIAKPGVPFVTTEPDDGVAAVLEVEARSRGAPFERVPVARGAGFVLGLAGPHQVANAALAVRLAELLPPRFGVNEAAVRSGLRDARLPGRFDRRGRWLFDVAHNPDGIRSLVSALRVTSVPRPVVAVVSILKDKAWREMLELLAPSVEALMLTCAPSAPADRAWSLEEAEAWARSAGLPVTAESDFDRALALAGRGAATALVTGSFHTVGDAMARLPGVAPLG